MFTRERHRRGVWYFGPYANAKKVRETLDVLNRVFRFRPCEGPKPGRHSGIPCLDYHIDRCLAPCVGYVSKEDYRAIIDERDRVPLRQREAGPARARAEDARRPPTTSGSKRPRATATGCTRSSTSSSGRRADRQSVGDVDVIGFAAEGDRAVVQIFPLRGGKMVDRLLVPRRERRRPGSDDGARGVQPRVLRRRRRAVPPQIVVPRDAGDLSALEEFLSERRGARVEVRTAERGEKRRLAGARRRERAPRALDRPGAERAEAARGASSRSRSCARR